MSYCQTTELVGYVGFIKFMGFVEFVGLKRSPKSGVERQDRRTRYTLSLHPWQPQGLPLQNKILFACGCRARQTGGLYIP